MIIRQGRYLSKLNNKNYYVFNIFADYGYVLLWIYK